MDSVSQSGAERKTEDPQSKPPFFSICTSFCFQGEKYVIENHIGDNLDFIWSCNEDEKTNKTLLLISVSYVVVM